MIDWIKQHVEALVCFFLFGLLILTGLYFLSVEEQRITLEDLEKVRVDESARDAMIRRELEDIAIQRRRAMTVFADRSILHYDLVLRRNPFKPLSGVDVPDEPPPPPPNDEVPPPPPPNDEERPPRVELVVRGIVKFGSDFISNLENRKTGESYFRRVGEEVEGYKVEDIRENLVVLTREDKRFELKFPR